MKRILLTTVVTGVASALLLAGCSSTTSGSGSASSSGSSSASSSPSSASSASTSAASTSPGAAVRASLAAGTRAKTVHVVAAVKQAGQPVGLDVHYGSNGGSGSITTQGSKINLIFIGSTVYFKAPNSFYRKTEGANAGAVIRVLSGKWAKTSTGSTAGKGFTELASRADLFRSLTSGFSAKDAASTRRSGSSTVDGMPTTTYTDTSDSATIDIAASGTPYPLKVVSRTGLDRGTLTFTDWDKPFTAAPPPTSQTVNLPS